jgi:hypothetical protein
LNQILDYFRLSRPVGIRETIKRYSLQDNNPIVDVEERQRVGRKRCGVLLEEVGKVHTLAGFDADYQTLTKS